MTVFAVSFRIADQTSSLGTYGERWQSVNNAIQGAARGTNYWKQTTSFFVLESDENSSPSLATVIDNASKLDKARDLLLVINLDQKGYKVLGVNPDSDLDKIMSLRK